MKPSLCGFSVSVLMAAFGIALQAAPQTTAVPRPVPTYNEVYEFCLAAYAGSGVGRSLGTVGIVLDCSTQAAQASEGPRPTVTAWTAQYQQCLLGFAVNGAPRGGDLSVYCSGLATAISGETPPDKRYVIFQQPGADQQGRRGYGEAYDRCLVMLAESGIGRGISLDGIVRSCNEAAAQQSGAPKPEATPYAEVYDRCLLSFAQFGAPQGLDLGTACTDVATDETSQPPANTTRQPR